MTVGCPKLRVNSNVDFLDIIAFVVTISIRVYPYLDIQDLNKGCAFDFYLQKSSWFAVGSWQLAVGSRKL